MRSTIHSSAVKRAAVIAGGVAALAADLKVPLGLVEVWAQGAEEVPPAIFIKVVDIILERQLSELRAASPQS